MLIGRALRPPRFRRATRGRRGLPRSSALGHRCGELVPRDPYVREKFINEVCAARQHARQYSSATRRIDVKSEVERWREIQSKHLEFAMKRPARANRTLSRCQQQGTYFDAPSLICVPLTAVQDSGSASLNARLEAASGSDVP